MRLFKPMLLFVILFTAFVLPLQVVAGNNMLQSPPDLVGEVSQLFARQIVVADRSVQLDGGSRIESLSGLILSRAQLRRGRTVAVYLRDVNIPGTSIVRKLILLK